MAVENAQEGATTYCSLSLRRLPVKPECIYRCYNPPRRMEMSAPQLKPKSKLTDPGMRWECSCSKWQAVVPEVGQAGWMTERARMRLVKRKFKRHVRMAHPPEVLQTEVGQS